MLNGALDESGVAETQPTASHEDEKNAERLDSALSVPSRSVWCTPSRTRRASSVMVSRTDESVARMTWRPS